MTTTIVGGSTITGVAYEGTTGDVYLSGNAGLNTDTLYLVPNESANATTSLVSTGPHRDVTAMALTVPEPAAVAAFGLGGFALVWRLCAMRARFRRS